VLGDQMKSANKVEKRRSPGGIFAPTLGRHGQDLPMLAMSLVATVGFLLLLELMNEG